MALDSDFLSNQWFYSQHFQEELEQFYGFTEHQNDHQEDKDPFIGCQDQEVASVDLSPSCTPSSTTMEENYSDCFFSQCTDPFEQLLTPKAEPIEDYIEIDVERSVSPPSLPSINDDMDLLDMDLDLKQQGDTQVVDVKPTPCYKVIHRRPVAPVEKTQRHQSRRGRPQNVRPISLKAQISKDWREKKKRQDAVVQEKVIKLEVENLQLNKENSKLKNDVRALRKLVEQLTKGR